MSRRTERVQSLIRHELGTIFQQELKDPRIAGVVSITTVEMSADLRLAHVYVSIFGDQVEPREALDALNSATPFLRRELGSRLDLRYLPQLQIHLDRSLAYADRVSRLLKDLPASPE